MSFTDDFERADGPLGPNWSTDDAFVSISGGHVVASVGRSAWVVAAQGSGDQSATITVTNAYALGQDTCVNIKADAGYNSFYRARKTWTGQRSLILEKVSGGSPTTIASVVIPDNYSGTTDITLSYTGAGALHASISDGYSCDATDTDFAANAYVGMSLFRSDTWVNYFSTTSPEPATLTITPDPLWVGAGQQILAATLAGATWTPGEPGSTTFSADHGTVDLQEVTSGTEAVFLYTPAEYIGAITFTESEYSAEDTINAVAIRPEGEGSGECLLTPEGAALVNNTAADTPLADVLWKRSTDVGIPGMQVATAEVVKWLADFLIANAWNQTPNPNTTFTILHELLNGGYDPTPGLNVLGELNTLSGDLAAHDQRLADIQGAGGVTLAVLAAALSDLRGVGSPSIKDVLDAVGNVNNDDVMTYLQALRGNDVVNLLQVVTALTNIQTLNGYDLGTIVQRLDDRPTTLNMNAAFAITNGAIGGLALEIAGLYKALGVVEATNIFDVISGILGDLFSGLGQEVVDQFLDSIFGPETPLPQIVLVPPIWPGLSRANVGNAVALQNGQTIAGPLHGLLFTIDQQPTEKYAYHFGNVRSWGRVGAVIFATDRGDYERSQTFALDTQVLCPQQMAVADHAIIKVNSGWGGTVRPWTITQPQSP